MEISHNWVNKIMDEEDFNKAFFSVISPGQGSAIIYS